MNTIERSRCAVTGKTDLEPLYNFRSFPVFMGCIDQIVELDLRENMSWSISRSSGLIQLNKLLPLEVLYPESHGSGCIGDLWNSHHKAFANFLYKASPAAVIEIGGAHGILAKEYKQFGKIPWTILEPNPSPVDGCDARFIKGFFDDKFLYSDAFDTVVHSHVFEHIYEPVQFMRHLAGFIDEGKRLVFSLPNMKVMLERKYNNCLNFEHTVFLTEPYVEFLLAEFGFRVLTKEYFKEDHSIFYLAVRDPSVKPVKLPNSLYEKNRQLFMDYAEYHDELILDLNRKINGSNQPVYLFGAHVFSQCLIAFGLDTSRIVCLLDNDPEKHEKRLYGTHLMVQSPKILRQAMNPIVILRAGVYNNEIKSDIFKNINSETIFLE